MMEVPHKEKFIALSYALKRYYWFLVITVSSIGLSCSQKSNDSENPTLSLNPVALKCYRFANHNDTIFLTMEHKDDSVVGNLVYRLFQKDMNSGVINGKMEKDFLIADYTFQSEGMQSLRQVVLSGSGIILLKDMGKSKIEMVVATFGILTH